MHLGLAKAHCKEKRVTHKHTAIDAHNEMMIPQQGIDALSQGNVPQSKHNQRSSDKTKPPQR